MSATHAAKQEQIDLIKDRFSRATAAVLVDFRGLNVAKTTELRNAFRKVGVEYKVLKNTLIEKAVKGPRWQTRSSWPTWSVRPEWLGASRIRRPRRRCFGTSARTKPSRPSLAIKCGVIENTVMEGTRVETELASMPGKDEIRAMLLATLLAPAQSLGASAPGHRPEPHLRTRRTQASARSRAE